MCILLYIYIESLCATCGHKLGTYYGQYHNDEQCSILPLRVSKLINLALIKDEPRKLMTVQHSVDDILCTKESLVYEDIFQNVEENRLILLVGRPGCGKTTLMNKISHDWKNKIILQSRLLILVYLRSLNTKNDRDLATILRSSCPALYQTEIDHLKSVIEGCNGKDIVFAFDLSLIHI